MPKIAKIKDNIVTLKGEANYKQNQYYRLSEDTNGLVLSATSNEAQLLVVGNPSNIEINEEVSTISDENVVDVYEHYFDKIISPFGDVLHPQDFSVPAKPKSIGVRKYPLTSPSILERIKLSQPLDTGIVAIDTMIPIGLGQRELIIGDRATGKTSIALSAIINQKSSGIKTIYVSVGQKRSSVIDFYKNLVDNKAAENVITIFANPDSAAQQFLAPSMGMAMAEALAYQGEDVLVVVDDLTKHANVYREISLSIGRSPGREAYPTDIFFQHSSLLERAGRFNEKYKNGSITCLPIVETVQGDIASLIPSNVISITDGQIFTSAEAYNNGEFPAINIQLSVSRTGSAVQSKLIKAASNGLKAEHARLSEIKKFSDLSIDVSDSLVKKIDEWNGINNMVKQFGYKGLSRSVITIMTDLFSMGALGKLVEPLYFPNILSAFVKKDKVAKRIAKEIASGKLTEKKRKVIIKKLFVPLAKAASGEFGDLFSSKELKALKGVK